MFTPPAAESVAFSPWTRRTSCYLPERPLVPRPQYPQSTYFVALNFTHHKSGAKAQFSIKTLPPNYIEDPTLLREAVELFNRSWNPNGEAWADDLFSITPGQFRKMHQHSPGGTIAAFMGNRLVAMICALNLDSNKTEPFPESYDAIVTAPDYFNQSRYFYNARHCVAVLVPQEHQGYRSEADFNINGEAKKISLGQALVLAQKIEAQRSPYLVHLFADSRPSSLARYIKERMSGEATFTSTGSILISSGRLVFEVTPTEEGLVLADGSFYLSMEAYLKTPYDQMRVFHGTGMGAKVFKVLPNSRRKNLPDRRVVIDQDALGFNVIYQYDPLADFKDFFDHLTVRQKSFVKTFAQYLRDPASLKDAHLREMLKYLDAPLPYWKTVVAEAFSIEKIRAVRARLEQDNLLEEVASWKI